MKASKAEVVRRLDEVCRLRLEGARREDVLQYSAKKGWGLQPRQVEKYIRRADALLIAERGRNLKNIVGLHLARRQEIYRQAVAAKKYRVALAALDSEAKLAGLFPKDDFKILMKQMSQYEKRIEELEQRLRDSQAASAVMPPDYTMTEEGSHQNHSQPAQPNNSPQSPGPTIANPYPRLQPSPTMPSVSPQGRRADGKVSGGCGVPARRRKAA